MRVISCRSLRRRGDPALDYRGKAELQVERVKLPRPIFSRGIDFKNPNILGEQGDDEQKGRQKREKVRAAETKKRPLTAICEYKRGDVVNSRLQKKRQTKYQAYVNERIENIYYARTQSNGAPIEGMRTPKIRCISRKMPQELKPVERPFQWA